MLSRDEAWLLAEKYQGEKSAGFFTDCERLASGEPLGYVIGYVPFLNCEIWLDSKPLIPRPETEYWTEQAIKEISTTKMPVRLRSESERLAAGGIGWGDAGADESRVNEQVLAGTVSLGVTRPGSERPLRILDLCAGSGAVGVAVAKALPEVLITFGEIDTTHLPTIEKNCEVNGLTPEQYEIVASDLFENMEDTYDFILSNPPYINAAANTVDESVALHEPHLALFGGTDGMEVIEQIIVGARAQLAPPGQLWIEHEPEQTAAIATLAQNHHFTCHTHKDQYGIERYSILVVQ